MDKDTKQIIILLLLIMANFSSFYKGLKLEEQVEILKQEVEVKQNRIDALSKFEKVQL